MSALLLLLLGGVLIQVLALTSDTWPLGEEHAPSHMAAALTAASATTMLVVALAGWALDHLLLASAGLDHLHLLAVACCALIVIPALVSQLPRWLAVELDAPWFMLAVLVNPLVLGMALIAQARQLTLSATAGWTLAAGLVQAVLLFCLLALHERLQRAPVPASFRQLPILLVTTGIAALALMGFTGLIRE